MTVDHDHNDGALRLTKEQWKLRDERLSWGKQHIEDLGKESERGSVILGALLLENLLEKNLREFMNMRTPAKGDLFSRSQPLASFHSKIHISTALGLFNKNLKAALICVKEIRNKIAHDIDRSSLADEKGKVEELEHILKVDYWLGPSLELYRLMMGKENPDEDVKTRYVVCVVILAQFLHETCDEIKPLIPQEFAMLSEEPEDES